MTLYVHKNPIARLYYDEWNFCGCGSPEEFVEFLKNVLSAFDERRKSDWEINNIKKIVDYDQPLGLFFLYWLTSMDILEHGGSVYGSWLTVKGEIILSLLNQTDLADFDSDPELVEVENKPSIDEILP